MKYFYVPSTHIGFIGRGYGGGGGFNCGYLVGCGAGGEKIVKKLPLKQAKIDGFFKPLPPVPPPLPEVPLYKQKKKKFTAEDWEKLAKAEETGEIVDLTKPEFSLWSFVADKARAAWNNTKNFVVDKYNKVKGWFKSKIDAAREKIASIKKALGQTWYGTKVMGKALGKVAIALLKQLGTAGLTVTTELVKSLGPVLGSAGWTPLMIAQGINLLRRPHSFWEMAALKGIETLPSLLSLAAKATIGAGIYGYGIYGYGKAGKKIRRRPQRTKRGYLRKGSPEAKAHMAYLRSLRRT